MLKRAANRQLWLWEARDHYVPNPSLCLRVARADGADAWVSLHQVMTLAWHESHLEECAIAAGPRGARDPGGRLDP